MDGRDGWEGWMGGMDGWKQKKLWMGGEERMEGVRKDGRGKRDIIYSFYSKDQSNNQAKPNPFVYIERDFLSDIFLSWVL
jgi:hypothetical protein